MYFQFNINVSIYINIFDVPKKGVSPKQIQEKNPKKRCAIRKKEGRARLYETETKNKYGMKWKREILFLKS